MNVTKIIKIKGEQKTITINALKTGSVELKLLHTIYECKAIDNIVYNQLIKFLGVYDWSNEKRPVSFDFKEFFESSLKLASSIKSADKAELLNGIVYKKSESGRYQLMPCWYYLTGCKKAFINYCQTDFKLKVSKYEIEQAKKCPLPVKKITAVKVEQKQTVKA